MTEVEELIAKIDKFEKLLKKTNELCKGQELAIANLRSMMNLVMKENKVLARKIRDMESGLRAKK